MFRLLRYFSVTSLAAFAVVVVIFALFYRQNALASLIELRESSNVFVTQIVGNTVWGDFGSWVVDTTEREVDDVLADPTIDALHQTVLEEVRGSTVVKVKIYNTAFTTVYSSESEELGENAEGNDAYLTALGGGLFSELDFEDTVVAFEGDLANRYIVESYVPFYAPNGELEGVFEIYDDATSFVQSIEARQRQVVLSIAALLGLLYLALFFIVRRADRILKRQRAEIETQNQSLVKANRDLAIARKQAENANRLKSQFLSTMSHELRTPLNAVIGYAQLQLAGMAGEMSEAQHGFQERILINARHLLQLINEVLDLSKIEAGRLDIVQEPFELRPFIDEIVQQNRVLAEEKGLNFTINVDERLPQTVHGDSGRIKQIIINLLSNAIKFTDEGGVTLETTLYDKDKVRFMVEDTGVGIPPHQQEHIFDEFRQVDSSFGRGGTGLGLAIVRKLVLMMGGNIRVKSEVGRGSTFTVTLPIITEAVTQPEAQASA